MRCYHTYDKGKKYLIPHCMSVLNSNDIADCTCEPYLTDHHFEKERYNKVLTEKNEIIKQLLYENKILMQEIKELKK